MVAILGFKTKDDFFHWTFIIIIITFFQQKRYRLSSLLSNTIQGDTKVRKYKEAPRTSMTIVHLLDIYCMHIRYIPNRVVESNIFKVWKILENGILSQAFLMDICMLNISNCSLKSEFNRSLQKRFVDF